jgi:glutathione S-transferase
VPYPIHYAPESEAATSIEKYQFNCAQRAHYNWLENLPNFLITLFVAGLKFPEWSAGLGAVYLVGRILYATGYTRPIRDGGRGRYNGMIYYVGIFGLTGLAVTTVYQSLM